MVFQPGQVANPNGRGNKPHQDFVGRARYLVNEHEIDELRELATNKKKFGKLSVFDGMIVMRLYEALEVGGKDSMNALLDRLIGKPKQEIAVDSTVQVNVVLQSAVSEVRSLDASALAQISALLESNVINGDYTEIKDGE